jgi:hypothetical protein
MNEIWSSIVADALKEGLQSSRGAIPGARLRQLIARIAPKYGEQYPPQGEQQKFGEFLKKL